MSENYDISEIEDLVKEDEPEPTQDKSSLWLSSFAYKLAILIIDAGTGYLIWQLTFWYYGLIWFLAGAVVFFLHEKNFFTAGNNDKQIKSSQSGVIVSVVSMLIMAMVSGGLYVFGVKNLWVEVGLIVTSLGLFFWHAFQLAMYVFNDDGFRIKNTITRSFAQANKKKEIAKASGIVVRAHREAEKEKKAQYQKHGQANIDAAIGKMNGKQFQQPARQFAKDTETPELDSRPNSQAGKHSS